MKTHHFFCSVISVFLFATASQAQQARTQQATTPAPPSTGGAVQNSPTGIRFALLEQNINPRTVYIPLNSESARKVTFRPNFPTERIPFPQNGKLAFYTENPLLPQEEGKPPSPAIFTSDIPTNKGNKIIGLIGKTPDNKFYVVYVPDMDLKPGTTLLKNLTNKEYALKLKAAPTGEKDTIMLSPGAEYIFGKNISSASGAKTFGSTLMHQADFKGELVWLPARKFMLTSSPEKAFIKIILPNPATQSIQITDITLTIESIYPSTAPSAARPRTNAN